MSAPTPGPWTFSRWNEFGDMRFYIAQADGAPHTPRYSDVATLIAETTSNEWQSIQEANARLIAAAPEMLELLKAVSAALYINDYGDWALNSNFHADGIDQIIAKATGSAT
jgi:hypothetical protein